jgi:hypothetical protein
VTQDIEEINKQLGLNLDIATATYARETGEIYNGQEENDEKLERFLSYEEIIAALV